MPQVHISGALFNTLICDVSDVDPNIVGWDDPSDFEKVSHNAIHDVPGLAEMDVWSTVTHWENRWKFFHRDYSESNLSLHENGLSEHEPLWSFLALN